MAMAINNMDKPTINVPEVPEDTASRLEILIWGNNYKEAKWKETTLKKHNKNTYRLIIHHYTP